MTGLDEAKKSSVKAILQSFQEVTLNQDLLYIVLKTAVLLFYSLVSEDAVIISHDS